MPHDARRFATLFAGGLICLVVPASAAQAQTRPHAFEIAAGTMYGLQDPERPVTAGWIVSSGFDLGRQSFVVEGAWHRDAYVLEHPWDFGEVFREKLQSRYWMLMGGVRGGERQGRMVPYYPVLAGGFAARFRRDYEWPAAIDTETANAECGGYIDGVLVHPCLYVPYPGTGASWAASTWRSASRSAWGTRADCRRRASVPRRESPPPAGTAEPGARASPSSAQRQSSTRGRPRRSRPTSPAGPHRTARPSAPETRTPA